MSLAATISSHASPDVKSNQKSSDANIWSSILSSSATSKAIPTKTILILGDPQCGKSTLIHELDHAHPLETLQSTSTVEVTGVSTSTHTRKHNQDLGLSYDYVEVTDEDNEDVIARLSFYHISHFQSTLTSLLQIPFSPSSLKDFAAIIAIDWSKPWSIVEQVERWLRVLETLISQIANKGEQIRTEARESKELGDDSESILDADWLDNLKDNLRSHIQTYTEPAQASAEGAASITTSNSTPSTVPPDQNVLLPLGEGVLIRNLGIPIFIVCCKVFRLSSTLNVLRKLICGGGVFFFKSDAMANLERDSDFKEPKFDLIQQSLRTVALQYGASVTYTSPSYPRTFSILKAYLVHRLLPSYSFAQRAQIVERETVFVPSGWDSWTKINLLREGFSPELFNLDGLPLGNVLFEEGKALWESVIGKDNSPQILPPPPVIAEDEQTFLDKQLEIMNKQATIVNSTSTIVPSVSSMSSAAPSSPSPGTESIATIQDDASEKLAKLKLSTSNPSHSSGSGVSRQSGVSGTPTPTISQLHSLSSSSNSGSTVNPASNTNPLSASAALPGSSSPSMSQNEVLANFFQSLLSKKGTSSGSSGVGSITSPSANSPSNVTPSGSVSGLKELDKTGSPGTQRRIVEKELERLRSAGGTGKESS
ncbi:dynein light intermediate chain-domain-containing protein [Paraphysoderma sedebokerense]|nr:dynein light intermediate chain-domain-containing protein [Paraphysoderma sedebokerense]